MTVFHLPQFAAPCKTHGPIHIGPRLRLRLCDELLELAHRHEKLSREIQFVADRFEVILALVNGARR